jgi:hypothetical protein
VKVGDLIYDSHYGQRGIVVEVTATPPSFGYMTIMYEDGVLDRGIRQDEHEIEVISESR